MQPIINSTFVSLDGVINHMDRWHFEYADDESGAIALEQLNAADTMLMGRNTYESYAGVWPDRHDALSDPTLTPDPLAGSAVGHVERDRGAEVEEAGIAVTDNGNEPHTDDGRTVATADPSAVRCRTGRRTPSHALRHRPGVRRVGHRSRARPTARVPNIPARRSAQMSATPAPR